jgi:hypothetical protein
MKQAWPPRQTWPPPAPVHETPPSSPTLTELKASLQQCASPRDGNDKSYSFMSAGVSTSTPPSLNDDVIAATKTLVFMTCLAPLLLVLVLYHTCADALAGTFTLLATLLIPAKTNSRGALSPTNRRDQRPALVFPGCGCYVFWQLGMVQFLVERYDLRGVKIAANGGGAVCAAFMLALEANAPGYPPPAACVVRKRARAMQKAIDLGIDHKRLSQIFKNLLDEFLPGMDHLAMGHDRIAIGFRTLQCRPLPVLYPAFCASFRSREDFAQVVVAASCTAPIASWKPLRALRTALASDGVNALSLWCLLTYPLALMTRNGAAPGSMHPLSTLVAAWNFPVLNLIFKGSNACSKRTWVAPSPSVVWPHRLVAPTRAQTAALWAAGYERGRRLDAENAFAALDAPRRAVA